MRSRRSEGGWRTSLRVRLTLWNTAVVLLMTLATLVVVRFAASSMLHAEADASLRAAVEEITAALREYHPDVEAVVGDMRRMTASHRQRGWFMHLLTQDGDTVWMSDNCPDVVAAFPPSQLDRKEVVTQVGAYRYVRQWVRQPGRVRYHLRVGMHTAVIDEAVAGLMRLLLPVGAIITLLTPLAGYWLAMRATRPVAEILATAAHLRPTRLTDRLPEPGTGDELDRLSRTINRLLDQLAEHVDRQEQFVADAAHELRGPLAAVQSSLEVAIAGDMPAEEYREVLTDTLEATRQLSKVANDLLLLAEHAERPSNGGQHPAEDLGLIARQTAAMFAGVASDHGLAIHVEAPSAILVGGEASSLRRVVGNLLDNAIRFTPAGGRIILRTTSGPEDATLAVIDTGMGLAAEDVDRVFERFYKVDRARSHAEARQGSGLGLAICRSLVESIGGTIALTSVVGRGTTVTVTLPLVAAPLQPSGPAPVAVACPSAALG
jgi:two-component system heavy metal sensor histidine kinase CusS